MHKALHPRDMCQEKKEEGNLLALKTALAHRYNDSKTTEKNAEED